MELGFPVIEDAAHAVDSEYEGKPCGSIGDVGIYSFDAVKNLTTWEYDVSDIFIRMTPSDVSAAIGLAQLRRLDQLQERRRAIWDEYQRAFRDIEWIGTPLDPAVNETHSYFTYFIQMPHRDELARHLLKKGIYTTLRFHPLHLNAIYKSKKTLPNAEEVGSIGV